MTSAIFEILGLLTVSCLIGIFFTYRYWKAKMAALVTEKANLESENMSLKKEKDDLKKSNTQLSQEKSKADEAKASLEEKIAKLNKEKASLEAEKSKLESDLKKAKSTPAPAAKSEDPKEIKALKDKIELMEQALGEKERELEAVSLELDVKKVSYYKQIDGKRYKAKTIIMADKAVEGKGDGRISMEDAKMIFDTISDGHAYTQVEKDTMHYLRENYNWTESADELFRTKVRSWAAKGHELDS